METISEMAIKSVENLAEKNKDALEDVGLIIVASTNYEDAMPGVSFQIQKKFTIQNCMCMDILAGCSGYHKWNRYLQRNILNLMK